MKSIVAVIASLTLLFAGIYIVLMLRINSTPGAFNYPASNISEPNRQAIEKTLKAYWCATLPEDPPYTHSHKRLADGCGLYSRMSKEQKDFINTVTNYNIEARYPEDKDELTRTLTPQACRQMIDETKQLTQWIKDELSAATKPSTSSDTTSES